MSALLAKLIEAGTPADLVAEVALELARAQAAQEALEARRKHDRERKARSRDVTGQDVTSNVVPLRVSPDKEKSPKPPKEINPIPCERGRATGFHRLPDGWHPTKPFPPQLQAKVDQWPPGMLEDQIACLKRWSANAPDQNGKGRKLDWDKALWNWLTRFHDERRPAKSNGIGKSQAAYRLATANLDPDEPF